MIKGIKDLYRLHFLKYSFHNTIYVSEYAMFYPKGRGHYTDEKTIQQFIKDGFK